MAKLTGDACRAARGILKWSTAELAKQADVSPTTINTLENGGNIRQSTEDKIKAAFLAHNVEITNGNGTGARRINI